MNFALWLGYLAIPDAGRYKILKGLWALLLLFLAVAGQIYAIGP